MPKGKKLVLSVNKICKLLNQNNFSLIGIYYIEDENKTRLAKFLAIKTGLHQKIFFVHIPDKYIIKLKKDKKLIKLVPTLEPTKRQKDYILEMQEIWPENIALDIVMYCPTLLSYYKNGVYTTFTFGDNKIQDAKEVDEADIVNDIETSIEKVEGVQTKKNSKLQIVVPKQEREIIFQDQEGEKIDDVTTILYDEDEHNENLFIPEHDWPENINLGTFYTSMDISTFTKNILDFENIIVKACQTIDENKNETRNNQVKNIQEKIQLLSRKLDREIGKIKDSQTTAKINQNRLTIALGKLYTALDKAKKNKTGDKSQDLDLILNIERTIEKTKNAISTTSIDLAQLDESSFEFLNTCELSIDNLLV